MFILDTNVVSELMRHGPRSRGRVMASQNVRHPVEDLFSNGGW